MAEEFDVIVIGAGPGGYVAAIRAAQNGLKVACVESRETLGGTCLNVGCIPSKALLHASELYAHAADGSLAKFGVETSGVKLNLKAMLEEKLTAVKGLTDGIAFLFKKNKVTWLKGHARFTGKVSIDVDGTSYTAKAFVVATGSSVTPLPGVEIDQKVVVDSTGALSFAKVPDHLVVIGGGVIGLELGSVWLRLGAKVTVVEYLDQILPGMDGDVRKEMARLLKKQGMTFRTETKVTGVKVVKGKAAVTVEPAAGGTAETLDADAVLVSIGRRPNTDGLDLEKAGVKLNARGQIEVSHKFETGVDGIYAIGDVTPGPMLAHKAEDEGVAVADFLSGRVGYVNHEVIPAVVYTMPEAASVGKTEDELKSAGVEVKVGKFPFVGNSRAKTNRDTDGFVKVIADAKTDRVLGVHIVGSLAGTMIAQAAQAMEFGASSEDIALTCHAHPTHSEALKEAAMAVEGKAIHV
ncbi:dihydrolipoyl dehydrogenase [Sphingosinicella soli]|uniref:Dihydrolipoyl dehydrogenase n=1 Tax=Sphingosinicella soli TaxID=333708 RepID=A0A7W7F5A8_9SPHN|nr:dihydrolipoyl dehydrogenase [Sphingosinicella soli]MBB4631205.1 dihydrolipoamide dehydrogenase [Sphingosinicella soli]